MEHFYIEDYVKLIIYEDKDETLYSIVTEDDCELTLNNVELKQLKKILSRIKL